MAPRKKTSEIQRYIVENVGQYPAEIAKITAKHFGITRQGVSRHLQHLVAEGVLNETGETRARTYKLASLVKWHKTYPLTTDLEEDQVWTNDVKKAIAPLPDNVLGIWSFCFTEMFNNAKDHSEGTEITVFVEKTPAATEILIVDDGVGIFRKIQKAHRLLDERHAILELAKGKLTTDPKNHSGLGIFFTSRMVDSFDIISGGVAYSHEFGRQEDWIMERTEPKNGTSVWMRLSNNTARTQNEIFEKFDANVDEIGFAKTVVPVRLARHGNDQLVSRSQAKRILARVDQFKTVVFDFDGVPTVGQGFADHIFRVFANEHPNIDLYYTNASTEVKRMVEAAKAMKSRTPERSSFPWPMADDEDPGKA
jgi:hypothetical protein